MKTDQSSTQSLVREQLRAIARLPSKDRLRKLTIELACDTHTNHTHGIDKTIAETLDYNEGNSITHNGMPLLPSTFSQHLIGRSVLEPLLSFPNLTCLIIESSDLVLTDDTISVIAKALPRLEFLHLVETFGGFTLKSFLTLKALRILNEFCPRIHKRCR